MHLYTHCVQRLKFLYTYSIKILKQTYTYNRLLKNIQLNIQILIHPYTLYIQIRKLPYTYSIQLLKKRVHIVLTIAIISQYLKYSNEYSNTNTPVHTLSKYLNNHTHTQHTFKQHYI